MPSGTTDIDGIDLLRAEAALLDTDSQAVIGTLLPGEIVYWNEAAERLYGWTADEVLGRSILEVTPTFLSRERAEEIMKALNEGRSWSGSFDVQTKAGTEFLARVQDVPVKNRRGELIGLIGISSLVTVSGSSRPDPARWLAP